MRSGGESRAVDAENESAESSASLYRLLPSVNDLLLMGPVKTLTEQHSRRAVVRAARIVLDDLRAEISGGEHTRKSLLDGIVALPEAIAEQLLRPYRYSLRPVINATGVILHTNLGRAPLSRKALENVVAVASGYSNLEFDLASGERGSRDEHAESLLLALFAEAAGLEDPHRTHRGIVVNNCAAATFLALHALARNKEVVVSRGELVEIGGGFRIPEILEASGAVLKEVGTTNRTRIADYENALTGNTGLILRVHQSNFSMEGFVARARMDELAALAARSGIPVFADQGTGLVQAFAPGSDEETISQCLAHGCDLIAASGDKLLGGPQCGILMGRKDLVDAIRKDPLFRTFRVDKMVYAALEATLAVYLFETPQQIPIVRMLEEKPERIQARCQMVVKQIEGGRLAFAVVPVESVVGGGTAPRTQLASHAISLRHEEWNAAELLDALRQCEPAIIGRIADDQVLLDLRTVEPDSDAYLVEALSRLSRAHLGPGKKTRE
jgi:L-seryl-tRNA(Ser) seleniumtransferase